MINLTLTILFITVLFMITMSVKSLSRIKVCALCSAVSITWIVLLILFYTGFEIEPIIIALLVGGTVAGLTNKLAQKLPEKFTVFKLPFYLVSLFVAYLLVEQIFIWNAFWVVLTIWAISLFVYTFRNSRALSDSFEKIINCCKNW